jgi:hypothetical protein
MTGKWQVRWMGEVAQLVSWASPGGIRGAIFEFCIWNCRRKLHWVLFRDGGSPKIIDAGDGIRRESPALSLQQLQEMVQRPFDVKVELDRLRDKALDNLMKEHDYFALCWADLDDQRSLEDLVRWMRLPRTASGLQQAACLAPELIAKGEGDALSAACLGSYCGRRILFATMKEGGEGVVLDATGDVLRRSSLSAGDLKRMGADVASVQKHLADFSGSVLQHVWQRRVDLMRAWRGIPYE